eukprot:897219-Rhodomonas_salina.1
MQETAFLVQFVLKMRFLVFDLGGITVVPGRGVAHPDGGQRRWRCTLPTYMIALMHVTRINDSADARYPHT